MNTVHQRPHVLINFAITANGRMANPDGSQLSISNEEDKRAVHILRNEHDAILVGINTVLLDNPKLTVKEKYVPEPSHPVRLVLDSNGRTPEGALVLDGRVETIIVTNEACSREFQNAEIIRCGKGRVDIEKLLETLHQRGVQSVMVEGGPIVIQSFLNDGVANRMRVFVRGMSAEEQESSRQVGKLVDSSSHRGGDLGDVVGGPAFPEDFAATIYNSMKVSKITTLGNGMVMEYKLKQLK
jgi:2,5-diamino-6-(ribosylamino)-4(3H)-pyrimidinone 5'-phosphate reductase